MVTRFSYFSKSLTPQYVSPENQRMARNIKSIRITEVSIKLGQIKRTPIDEQHFDLIKQGDENNVIEMTIPAGLYESGSTWAAVVCTKFKEATGLDLTYTLDPSNSFLKFASPSNIQVQRTEPVRVQGHTAFVSFSTTEDINNPDSEKPAPNIHIACPIPDGFYTPYTYAKALEDTLNVQVSGNTNQVYTVTYNRQVDRFEIDLSMSGDNNRFLWFNTPAVDYTGFTSRIVWHRFGGEPTKKRANIAPRQLNRTTPSLAIVGYPFGVNRGVLADFDKGYISLDGSYDVVLLCSDDLRQHSILCNGNTSNVLQSIPTFGAVEEWITAAYPNCAWSTPTNGEDFNHLSFYCSDMAGHRFEDAKFIVSMEFI